MKKFLIIMVLCLLLSACNSSAEVTRVTPTGVYVIQNGSEYFIPKSSIRAGIVKSGTLLCEEDGVWDTCQ